MQKYSNPIKRENTNIPEDGINIQSRISIILKWAKNSTDVEKCVSKDKEKV